MAADIEKHVESLAKATSTFAASHGAAVVHKYQSQCGLLMAWLQYLSFSQKTQVADSLLDGTASSVRETAACLGLGLVRPALFSMRTQIDLLLAWLYFKDHPVEWRTVNQTGDGYMMKREVLDYLNEHYKGFNARMNVLKEVAERSTEEPYRLLSAHVHAQSGPVLPNAAELKDVVYSNDLCNECTVLASEVGEYISDVLACTYASKWAAVPKLVRDNIEKRLATKKAVGDKKGAPERFFAGV